MKFLVVFTSSSFYDRYALIYLTLNEMIDMNSKYDNMYKNGMFYALICINYHVIACYQ